jgi:Mce-associated membrane protein
MSPMGDIVTSVQKAKMTSRGQVLASAVSGIDQDSATVLVVADAKVKTVFDTRARHFRWKVSLVKVNDRWLVDDFQPIS